MFAGAVTNRLLSAGMHRTGDASMAMAFLYEQSQKNIIKFLRNSSHAERLAAMGLKKDIKYCFQLDQTTVIPVMEGKYLVKLA
jgi:2-phosphosulfolactate phosphatase